MELKDLLKKIVDNEVLSESTKTELETALNSIVTESVNTAKVETETKVRLELTEQFVADKEALIEAIDTKTEEFLNAQIEELKESIEQFRDLEVEYAAKLVEAREEMAETVKKDMETLVNRLDEFLDLRIEEEMKELKEDIEQVKTIKFGSKLFEAFKAEFAAKFADEDESVAESITELAAAKEQLKESAKVLENVTKELEVVKRDQKISSLLESLQGSPREIMSLVLQKVNTDKLDETYNNFIGRVLHESVVSTSKVGTNKSEKENDASSVLAEGKDSSATGGDESTTRVVSGDTPILETQETVIPTAGALNESVKQRMKVLAGIE